MKKIRFFLKMVTRKQVVYLFKECSEQPNTSSWVGQRNANYIPSSKEKCSSPRRSPGPCLEGVRRVANSGARAQREGASLHLGPAGQEPPPRWVVHQARGSGHRQTAFLRGTKVGLTPSAAGPAPAACSSPGSRPGPARGGGGEPGCPSPGRSLGPVD